MNKQSLITLILLAIMCTANLSLAQTPTIQTAAELFKAQKWDEAAKLYEEIVKTEPGNGRAWYFLAMSRHSLGQYQPAVEAFQKNIAISNNPNAMYNLACAYSRLKQTDQAFDWLEKSLKSGIGPGINLSTDADLENLRSDVRFKAMLEIYDRKTKPCMFVPEARQFDFWVGDWDVYSVQGQKVASSRIESFSEGCGILENWTTVGNTGKSINYFDTNTKKWTQLWVGSGGAATMYVGEYADNKMVIDSVITNKDGKKTINRMTFFHLDTNTVRQLGEASNDDGKIWTPTFDFKYIRKK